MYFRSKIVKLYDKTNLQNLFPGLVSSNKAIPNTANGYIMETIPALVKRELIMKTYVMN